MWPDRVSNPGPLTYESGALPTAVRGPTEIELSNWYHEFTNWAGNTKRRHCKIYRQPAFAAMHGPHSLVRIGPGCADRA